MGKNAKRQQHSTPIRLALRALERIGNEGNLSGADHLRIQSVIDNLMKLAKKYEPLSTREVKKV